MMKVRRETDEAGRCENLDGSGEPWRVRRMLRAIEETGKGAGVFATTESTRKEEASCSSKPTKPHSHRSRRSMVPVENVRGDNEDQGCEDPIEQRLANAEARRNERPQYWASSAASRSIKAARTEAKAPLPSRSRLGAGCDRRNRSLPAPS